MKTFASLLRHRKGTAPTTVQQRARDEFSRRVAAGPMSIRRPGVPLPQSGTVFIVGVATYSAPDLELLDQIETALESQPKRQFAMEAFDVLDCSTMSDFEEFIPGVGPVFETPVVGVISEGTLIAKATGRANSEEMLRRFSVLTR